MTTFFTYGSGLFLIVLAVVVGIEFHDWLKERREENRAKRAVRRWEEHNWVPEVGPYDQEAYEEFIDMVDMSEDDLWVADGLEMLSIHATVAQKRDVPSWDEGQAA